MIANIGTLVERARGENVPVVWVQHSDDDLLRDSDAWQHVPELAPHDSEPRVHKSHGDAFEGTELEVLLAERGWGDSSWWARRPTHVSVRPCTELSCGVTT